MLNSFSFSPTQALKSIGTSKTDVNMTILSIFMASLLKGFSSNTYQLPIQLLEKGLLKIDLTINI
jgi:hypothetical protein